MTKKYSTKRSLVASILVLCIFVTSLIGTTFAWFTDSVTSGGNIIKSGTLEVTMQWKDATANGAQKTYKDASAGEIFNYEKWEPGYVEAKNVKIGNAGTLALKYQLSIVATGEVSALADVIDVYYAEGEYTLTDRETSELTYLGTLSEVLSKISGTASGDLLEGESDTVTLALKMQKDAGNEYQNLSIGSEFAVKCFATQLTSENDSFDNQYDKMATIDSEAELLEALAGDYKTIMLGSNITLTDCVTIPADKTVTIDLCGYTISQAYAQTAAYAMIYIKGNLTVADSIGTGKISYADVGTGGEYASNTIRNEGSLIVNGGTIENTTSDAVMSVGYPHAIDCYQGSTTTINGGTVKSVNYDSIRMFCNSATLATKVVINGGTIVNRVSFQNPNNSTHTPGYGILEINGGKLVTTDGVNANVRLLNFSRDYSNMKATVSGGTFDKGFKTQDYASCGVKTSDWLNMGTGVVVTTADELQAALDAATEDTVITFAAPITGNVVMPKNDIPFTINGNGYMLNGSINLNGTSNKTLKNIVFDAAGAQAAYDAYKGGTQRSTANIFGASKGGNIGACNIVIDGCTFTGTFANGGAAIAFADRSRSTGGSGDITIKDCTFNTENAYYDVYGYYTGAAGMTFTFENNTFASECLGSSIYLGRLATSEAIVVKSNAFMTKDSIENSVTIQAHSATYNPTLNATDNTFGG